MLGLSYFRIKEPSISNIKKINIIEPLVLVLKYFKIRGSLILGI
jgi:hypothetical protein